MILVQRGVEPPELAAVQVSKLAILRAIASTRLLTSNDIHGYALVADALWKAQHKKCCYCELKIPKGYNDVEHYRPKARSDRRPGCTEIHGYWWLAYSWANLLFACPACNRSAKNDQFPLMMGDTPLKAEEAPPGHERPLFLDPAGSVNPVEHIRFDYCPLQRSGAPSQWFARPRNGSVLGDWTIRVCDLNHSDKLELRLDHVEQTVTPQVTQLNAALNARDHIGIQREFSRALGMLKPPNVYVALSYDAFRHFIPNARLAPWNLAWPEPAQVGRP